MSSEQSPKGGNNRKNVKAPVFPVGPAGRTELRRALYRSTGDPRETIQKFQQSHSLHSMVARAFGTTPSYAAKAEAERNKNSASDDKKSDQKVETLESDPAMTFLSHLGVSQYEVHKRVADTILKHLEVEISKTQSQEPLLNLLKSCWVYATTIPELRPVLWAVLKQLGKDTPPAALKALAEQDENGELKHAEIFRPLPPLLKRLVWEADWEDKISREMAEDMEPKDFLERARTTLLGHTILPFLKQYCRNEYLVANANRPFVDRVNLRSMQTGHRRALNTVSSIAATTANPAAIGSASPKGAASTTVASTLSGLTSRASTGIASTLLSSATSNSATATADPAILSGKSIASLRQLLSDPTGGTASFRPKLLYAVLSILIAEHGSTDNNIMACSEHLHCTLVADLLLSAHGLPKAYQQVLRLAIALDDSVKAGVLKDSAIVKIQACLKVIFPAVKEAKEEEKVSTSSDKASLPNAKKLGKKEADASKTTPGKSANDPIHEPTTAFKRQLSRIIHGCCKAMKDADPQSLFLNPVTDAIAPGYSKVISTPMCIMTMEEKIDDHEYKTLQEWEEDVKLMFQNCITYNRGPAGKWFRGEAQRQRKIWKEEVLPQARRLYEKEVALRTKKDDLEDLSRKRKIPGEALDPMADVAALASRIVPLPAVVKKAEPPVAANAKPHAPDSVEESRQHYPSMPALASMLLADPFVVRLLLDRILRTLRLHVIRGKSLPTGHSVLPSLLQILHISQWSNQVCAVRGKQYIVPDGGLMAQQEEEQLSAEDIITRSIPFDCLRKFLPALSQLFLENELDQRVIVGGDLYDAFKSLEDARPSPPRPELWQSNNGIQGIVALTEGALVHICIPGNSAEASLAVTYPKFAKALQDASSSICDDRAFFLCLVDALLRHKNKLQRNTRDVVVTHWLEYLRKPPRHAKRKKGPKKQKKWGNITSAAHECFIVLLNEWASLGNQLLPRDMLVKVSSDAVQAAEESEVLADRKFLFLWNDCVGAKPEAEGVLGDFSPVRHQYERMLNSLPPNSRTQWREQHGLPEAETKHTNVELANTMSGDSAEEADETKMDVDTKTEDD